MRPSAPRRVAPALATCIACPSCEGLPETGRTCWGWRGEERRWCESVWTGEREGVAPLPTSDLRPSSTGAQAWRPALAITGSCARTSIQDFFAGPLSRP